MEIGIVGRARANGGAVSEGVGEGAGAALAELIHAAELRRASIRRLRHRRVAGGWRVILLGRLLTLPTVLEPDLDGTRREADRLAESGALLCVRKLVELVILWARGETWACEQTEGGGSF